MTGLIVGLILWAVGASWALGWIGAACWLMRQDVDDLEARVDHLEHLAARNSPAD